MKLNEFEKNQGQRNVKFSFCFEKTNEATFLREMFQNLEPLGNELVFPFGPLGFEIEIILSFVYHAER